MGQYKLKLKNDWMDVATSKIKRSYWFGNRTEQFLQKSRIKGILKLIERAEIVQRGGNSTTYIINF